IPRFSAPARSPDALMRSIALADNWAVASLPADPFAGLRRTAVLRAATETILGVVCGERWRRIEDRLLHGREPTVNDLREALGGERYQRELALHLARQGVRFEESDLHMRISKFAGALETHA